MKPNVILVGAGPGDPELITLKAVKALKNADVVLYDALINRSLLEYAPKNAPKIFVGKKGGKKSMQQEEINELIVRCANCYGTVVRLKGGDPFVFGRGFEELEFAKKFDLSTEVIPGVSSINAVPASANIPLTSRGLSESFWVITATTRNHELSRDIELAAQSTATMVILMGLRKLPEIVMVLQRAGKGNLPMAVISSGTTIEEKSVYGKADEILAKVEAANLSSPALIIAGKVAQQQENRTPAAELKAEWLNEFLTNKVA